MEVIEKKKKKRIENKINWKIRIWILLIIIFFLCALSFFIYHFVFRYFKSYELFEWKKGSSDDVFTVRILTKEEFERTDLPTKKKNDLLISWSPFNQNPDLNSKRNLFLWHFCLHEKKILGSQKERNFITFDNLEKDNFVAKKIEFRDKENDSVLWISEPLSDRNIKLDLNLHHYLSRFFSSKDGLAQNLQSLNFQQQSGSFLNSLAESFSKIFFFLLASFLFGIIAFWVFGIDIGGWFSNFQKERVFFVPKINFSDVIGLESAKRELLDIVDFFHHSELYETYNIKPIRGVLLVGPPGNGKTMLAKALAGECAVPFISCSGSEFEVVFVGLGARRIRNLFEKARSFPDGCIIFFDEFDSVANKRYMVNNFSSEKTLNQLLAELDGFKLNEKIFVLAATNSEETLDPAVIRPGRFDRRIMIEKPDMEARREILLAHCKTLKNIDFNINWAEAALTTGGLSVVQIISILEQAVIISIREKVKVVNDFIFFQAFDKIVFGISGSESERKIKNKKSELITSYHEAGHALMALLLSSELYVNRVTIIGPSSSIAGYTSIMIHGCSEEEKCFFNRKQLLYLIMSRLAGMVSEELIFGRDYVTSGSCNDLEKVSFLIRTFILEFGMSSLGVIPYWREKNGLSFVSPDLPEKSKEEIERIRCELLKFCLNKVKESLTKKKEMLVVLAKLLLKKKTLGRQELNRVFLTGFTSLSFFLPGK